MESTVTEPTSDQDRHKEISGVQQSNPVYKQTKNYVPSISGKKYDYVAVQMKDNKALHPDAHMFFQEQVQQASLDMIEMIMTQFSLKSKQKVQ
eukprot:7931398-Ditylum_brightwellii.AAC.1